MKLTVKRKQSIVEKFKKGESMAVIADWNDQPVKRIEGVIRDVLILGHTKLAAIDALNELKGVESISE